MEGFDDKKKGLELSHITSSIIIWVKKLFYEWLVLDDDRVAPRNFHHKEITFQNRCNWTFLRNYASLSIRDDHLSFFPSFFPSFFLSFFLSIKCVQFRKKASIFFGSHVSLSPLTYKKAYLYLSLASFLGIHFEIRYGGRYRVCAYLCYQENADLVFFMNGGNLKKWILFYCSGKQNWNKVASPGSNWNCLEVTTSIHFFHSCLTAFFDNTILASKISFKQEIV